MTRDDLGSVRSRIRAAMTRLVHRLAAAPRTLRAAALQRFARLGPVCRPTADLAALRDVSGASVSRMPPASSARLRVAFHPLMRRSRRLVLRQEPGNLPVFPSRGPRSPCHVVLATRASASEHLRASEISYEPLSPPPPRPSARCRAEGLSAFVVSTAVSCRTRCRARRALLPSAVRTTRPS